ncbi:MAG TPA: gliding motility-associated C-terminal domain-containing protein [Chitinophagaceae bacterium]|nr:gliding motility-associated C-terminal domain-containing protein [Chitinophagaceae bacterium]
MKKPVIILLLILGSSRMLNAQYLDLDWLKQQGGNVVDVAYNITIDANGNVFTIGNFSGTADFDPGPGTFNMTASGIMDAYVSKFDPAGNFLWAKRMGGSYYCFGFNITTDALGNVYLSGDFLTNIDVDPGPGVVNFIATPTGRDIFFVKLDPSGSFIWGKHITGPGGSIKYTRSLTVVNNEDIFITGEFSQTMDIDPGPGTYNLVTINQFSDGYIAKFDSSGNFRWAKQIGGIDIDYANDLCLDSFGNLLVVGQFRGTVDFDPGTGIYNQTSFGTWDGFILKLDNSGNFIWVKQMGGTSFTGCWCMELDILGNIYLGGSFYGTADFNPGPGIYNLTTFGAEDIFVCKLDPSGNFIWAGQIGGTRDDFVSDIHIDNNGKIYLAGNYYGTADVDPGPGSFNITSFGDRDLCIVVLNPSGTFITAKQMGGPGIFDFLHRSALDASGNLYITGIFDYATDFNPCIGPAILTGINVDIFTAKYHLKTASVSIVATSTTVCPGRPVTFTATPDHEGPSPFFQWQVNGINVGINSPAYTTSTLVNGDIVSVIMSSPCPIYAPLRSNSIIMTDDPAIPAAVINADTTIICSGTPVNFSAVPVNGGITPSYQWQVNGMNVGTNSPVFTSSSLSNGDMVRVLITSSDPCAAPGAFPSNTLTITVNPKATPSVFISTGNTIICPGATTTFRAIPTNGGPTPIYQWQVNNVNVGINDPFYITNTLNNGDNVKVLMTSSADCVLPGAFSSNTITVDPTVTPAVSIAAFPGDICYGTMVTFVASPTNGGINPSYKWQLNGSPAGTNRSSFITSTLVDGDIIDCIMTSNAACLSQATDTSGKIIIKIDPAICPVGFYMPTAFTPNKDGTNDYCKPFLFGKVLSYRFSLYNKWGQRIFETTDLQKGWDGKISGFNQDSNIFIWMCSYQFQNQPVEFKKGTVVLIR